MKCPDKLHWIPDREFCSKCPPGQVFNADWGECQGMDRTVINPGQYHTASAALFGYDGFGESKFMPIITAGITAIGTSAVLRVLDDKDILPSFVKKRFLGNNIGFGALGFHGGPKIAKWNVER